MKNLPNDIQLILNTREDLLNLNFDKPENELNLLQLPICHGLLNIHIKKKWIPIISPHHSC